MDPRDLAREFAAAAREMAEAVDEPVTAQTIVDRAAELFADVAGVSLTVRVRRGRYVTLAANSAIASELDELQYVLGEGPCVEASSTDDWFRSSDVPTETRWPRWGPQVAERGIASLLSVPLQRRGEPIGALNFYAAAAGRFDEREELDLALLYATHAAVALAATRDVSGLTSALHSRHVIGVAQGILVERYDLTLEKSFALLRRYSNDLNLPVSQVAEHIVTTRSLPPLDS